MSNSSTYCGDVEMARRLEKGGARISLSQTYGLFYGCHAAPHLVEPDQYMPEILDPLDEGNSSLEDTMGLLVSLIPLWNRIAEWDPEKTGFAFPDIHYPDTPEGLAARLKDRYALIEYFVKGLDMGHVAESDFSKGGMDALKSLSEAGALLSNFVDIVEKYDASQSGQLEKVAESTLQMEELAGDSIAQLNLSLKEARKREELWLTMHADPEMQIDGDAPCPCKSGKKYNRCCGLLN